VSERGQDSAWTASFLAKKIPAASIREVPWPPS